MLPQDSAELGDLTVRQASVAIAVEAPPPNPLLPRLTPLGGESGETRIGLSFRSRVHGLGRKVASRLGNNLASMAEQVVVKDATVRPDLLEGQHQIPQIDVSHVGQFPGGAGQNNFRQLVFLGDLEKHVDRCFPTQISCGVQIAKVFDHSPCLSAQVYAKAWQYMLQQEENSYVDVRQGDSQYEENQQQDTEDLVPAQPSDRAQ
jgi:hypothetical protein